jgi:hypothetical protein
MRTPWASQDIREAYGLFWRKKSGRRLPPELKGISFSNATTFSTRVRLRLLKELCRKHQLANPNLSCFITSYLARPELKIRDRRGLITSLTYTKAIQQLPQHLSLPFLQDLYQYARTNLPEKEITERFLILTPDLLLGAPPDQLSMSVDEASSQQQPDSNLVPVPGSQPVVTLPTSETQPQSFTPASEAILSTEAQPITQSFVLLPTTSTPSNSNVTYAALAALPPSTSGTQFAILQNSAPAPLSSTPAHTQTSSSSPTYATLTPVHVSPTDPLSGSFLATIPSSGQEPTNGDDSNSLHKRNRQRFAHKSAPYPPQN